MSQFRALVRRWHRATLLPADQLILTLGQDLFERPADLAVTHKMAALLRGAGGSHPDWRLPELNQELITIARNERKFLGFSDQDTGFDPDAHRGKVVVATVHKAKGLEWDRVYLMSVNAYDFPSALPGDSFIVGKVVPAGQPEPGSRGAGAIGDGRGQWTLDRGRRTKDEGQSRTAPLPSDADAGLPPLGAATEQARVDYAAERLRLLYVAITRARRDLIVTWNTGRNPNGALQPAAALIALRTWWECSVKRSAWCVFRDFALREVVSTQDSRITHHASRITQPLC